MNKDSKIFVAGHSGLVGSALVDELKRCGFHNLILKSHKELDLTDQGAVSQFYAKEKPEYVFLAAAKVGGILANKTYPADFIYQNTMIEANLIHHAYLSKVRKLLFLGSSCIYPKFAKQPIPESELLTGALEETNDAYAIAKIAGIKMCDAYNKQFGCNFISVMPTNLYGPRDNFDLQNSHVIPALVRKIHAAKVRGDKTVMIWGSGKPLREFLFSQDLANACVYLMSHCDAAEVGGIVNIGTGRDITIHDLALQLSEIIGYQGTFSFDATKPDGTPRKVLDVSKAQSLGWSAKTSFSDGLRKTYEWYLQALDSGALKV